MRRKYKLTLVAIAAICACLLAISISKGKEHYAGKQEKFSIYVVREGDTLWEISKKTSPGKDPREVIYTIQKKNDLDSAIIYPGQELLVPVE